MKTFMDGLQEATNRIEKIRTHFSKLDPTVITDEEVVLMSTDDDNRQLLEMMNEYIVTKYKKILKKLSIADAYAGLGGNTVYFAENFGNVLAYEILDDRLAKLKNNCRPYNNVTFDKDSEDETKGITAIYHDVIFLGIPWMKEPHEEMYKKAIKKCESIYQLQKAEFLFLMLPLRHKNENAFERLKRNMRIQGWEDIKERIVTRRQGTKQSYTIIYAHHPKNSFHVDPKLSVSDALLMQLRLLC
jgi:hypothetical protein